MRIKSIDVESVNIELNEPFSYFGATLNYLPYSLITIRTDCDIIGYGEAAAAWDVTGETQESVIGSINHVKKLIIGKEFNNLEEIKLILELINTYIAYNPSMKWAVETALLDILGKKLNLSVANIFSNKVKSEICFQAVLPYTENLDFVKKFTEGIISQGFNNLKIKVGKSFETDYSVLETIRLVSKDLKINVDVNCGWKNYNYAIKYIKKLELFNLSWIEQPTFALDVWSLKQLKESSKIPIMADESIKSNYDCKLLIEMNAIDMVNIKLAKCGGIIEGLKIVKLCEENNIEYMLGSMIESTIGTASNLQFASIINPITTDLGSLHRIKNDLALGINYIKNKIYVPKVSGMGITIK